MIINSNFQCSLAAILQQLETRTKSSSKMVPCASLKDNNRTSRESTVIDNYKIISEAWERCLTEMVIVVSVHLYGFLGSTIYRIWGLADYERTAKLNSANILS